MSRDQEILYDLLEIGYPIEIDVPTADGKFADIYFSQIMDVDERSLTVSLPQRQGSIASQLTPGADIFMRLALEDAIYSCTCTIRQWSQETPPSLVLGLPHRVHRIQRRNFVRVDARLPVKLIFHDQTGQTEEPFVIETLTTDISGGGLLVLAEYQLPLYQECQLELTLQEYQPPLESAEDDEEAEEAPEPVVVTASAQICRCQKQGSHQYVLGLSLVDIHESARDKIIRFIFKYQRDSLQRKPHLTL